ncbi:MAG: ABC transporter ATP-binding protein [Synergistaceae bacterium]|nr:ABC transporter ATP-binding protein [Synergistaceae bacterium]
MLKIEDLHVSYGAIHAVKGVSMSIPAGAIVTLIGANGAGKSSTIRDISGLLRGARGKILYTPPGGETANLSGMAPEDIVKLGITMSPEGRRILPHLTVEENLRLGAFTRTDKEGIEQDREYVYSLFPRLRERHWQKGGTLSGGEQQMLALGRAIMSRPHMVMLDEPSLGLAPLLVKEVFDIIGEINSLGKTVLLVEQNAFAALKIADYAYILEVGSIVLEGRGEDLLKDGRVKEAYLGG